MTRLENWALVEDVTNPFLAPELRGKRLTGNVYGREGFEDGTRIKTSSLQEFDMVNKIAKTLNTTYELGDMSEGFEKFLDSLNNN